MDVELFVHGVPYGEDAWGNIGEDRTLLGSFYVRSDDAVWMTVQKRVAGGQIYCYYTYLVYSRVAGNDGRDGAYFGMTLRFTEFCTDVIGVYRVLDTVYNLYILGTVLVRDKGRLRYCVSKFADVSSTLSGVRDAVYSMLGRALTADSFAVVGSEAAQGGAGQQLFLYDCTREAVLAAMANYGKLNVSPYYLGNREKALARQYEERLKAETDRRDAEAGRIEAELASARRRVAALESGMEQKEADVRRLSTELNTARQSAKIVKAIQPLVAPIRELAAAFRMIVPEAGDDRAVTAPAAQPARHARLCLASCVFTVANFLLLAFIAVTLALRAAGGGPAGEGRGHSAGADAAESVSAEAYGVAGDSQAEGLGGAGSDAAGAASDASGAVGGSQGPAGGQPAGGSPVQSSE